MKIFKNERGYALVLVLLTITIFTGLALSFMGQAASSVKQNKFVEEKSQSVALAEMGVKYFQSAVENAYEKNTETVNTIIKEEINREVNRIITEKKPIEDIHKMDWAKRASELMTGFLKTDLAPISNKVVEIKEDSGSFKITEDDIVIDYHKREILVKFTSMGIRESDSTKETRLKTRLFFSFPEINPVIERNDGGGEDKDNDENNDPKVKTPFDFDKIISVAIDCQKNKDSCKEHNYPQSTYFREVVIVNKGGRTFTVNGDAYFKKGIQLQGSSELIVYGDLYLDEPITSNNNFNASGVCVYGKIYGAVTDIVTQKNKCGNSSNGPNPNPQPNPSVPSYNSEIKWVRKPSNIDYSYEIDQVE